MNDTKISENVVYGYAGNTPLYLDIIRPEEATSTPFPVLVYIHGGGWMAGDKAGIGGQWNAGFVQHGFVAVNINHRLSGEAIFPAQIHDVKAAIRWLRANADPLSINPDKIGVWGHSSGAHLAALLGVSAGSEELEGASGNDAYTSEVQAVCTLSSPVDLLSMGDWHDLPHSPEARLVGARTVQEGGELATMANPLTYIKRTEPPFFLIHGDDDEVVPCAHSEQLYQALSDASFLRVKGADHGFSGGNLSMVEILEMVLSFFVKQLKGTPESIEAIQRSREETRQFIAHFHNQPASDNAPTE